MRWVSLKSANPEIPKSRNPEIPWGLAVVPLHGRGNRNGEGAGVRVLLYHPPADRNDPKAEWKTELIDDSMHMTHNFEVIPPEQSGIDSPLILLGGREGVASLRRDGTVWKRVPVNEMPASGPPSTGTGEVRYCRTDLSVKGTFVTVEPMHGNALVFSRADPSTVPPRMIRTLLTDKLVEGHALGTGDLLGTGTDQVVVGWRGNPSKADAKVGIALWTPLDIAAGNWRETLIDDNTMACEDLQLADLNGDGKLDIVAAGRATKNLKIYLNARSAGGK